MPRVDQDSDGNIRAYVNAIFDYWGRDWYTCGLCGKDLSYRGFIHHTKYDGATIYDLLIVCRSCNTLPENQLLDQKNACSCVCGKCCHTD